MTAQISGLEYNVTLSLYCIIWNGVSLGDCFSNLILYFHVLELLGPKEQLLFASLTQDT